MPLFDKKPFVRNRPPKDLSPNEELFYCQLTQEVFREYEEFFERVILCNSLVWSCSLTGRSNLTFAEALESEEAARESLRNFPSALKKPVLFIASLTDRGRLNDMCDDVFVYMKDRYFVGEEVEAIVNGVKRSCEVTQVVLPERQQRTPVKNDSKQRKLKEITPSKIKYEVVDYATGKTTIVKSEHVSRLKGSYTKPKNKLYIKHNTKPVGGVWKVKEKVEKNLQLDEFQFSEAFAGPPPSYDASPNKKKLANFPERIERPGRRTIQGKLNFKKESAEEKKVAQQKQALFEKERLAAEKVRQKAKQDLKRRLEEDKEKQRLEKLKEREKRKEEKKIKTEYLNSWKKPRDDLECDDLKELPLPTPIECGIPQSCFGDAIMVLEFLNTFGEQLQIKNTFPNGFSFENIEKALIETDIQGIFNDLLQLFLTSLFQLQESDDDTTNGGSKDSMKALDKDNPDIDDVMSLAAFSATWPQKYHGTALRNMPLDSFSITEILRLHILSSGARCRVSYQGVTNPSEDPGLYFKMEEPQLVKTLATTNVFQLSCEDRVKILNLLINQLLNCGTLRYAVDENADKTRPLRHQLKQLRWAQTRKQKEDILNRKKGPQKEEGSEEVQADDEEKENTDNLSPEEKAELEEKRSKDAAKQKAEFQRKEREIEAQIRKLQSSFNVTPIGRDRSYRRYWIFQTVAGIFLEDDDPFKGSCLLKQTAQQTPSASLNRSDASTPSIKKYMQHLDETKNGSSDKENEILRDIALVQNDIASPLKHRKLSDLNPRVDLKKSTAESNVIESQTCLQCRNKVDLQDDLTWFCPHSKNSSFLLDQCTANIDTCPVHNNNAPITKWSFFYQEEDLEALLCGLNNRGFRERSLKEALVNEKERIKEMMSRCPSNLFNKTISVASQQELRKSQRQRQSHSSAYANMLPQEALDLTLRDMILELEHRIFAGGLGSLKVPDREAWRTSLENGKYDMQCDKISWRKSDEILCRVKPDPDSGEFPLSEMVKSLASAMLQVSQGIEAKYLLPPLGESEASKASRLKAMNDSTSGEPQPKKRDGTAKAPASLLEQWQESLMENTSVSQLFVHLGTLEKSVAWSRSVLKAHCKICRRRGDAENMLLCDGCNRGHHLYCLKPPLEAIPEGDWFCVTCKPVEKAVSPLKKEKVDSDSDMEDGSSENESEESEEDEDNEDSEMTTNETFIEESCETCGDVGTLICCDKCPLMFHPECVNLKRIPRGEWLCPMCIKKDEALKRARKHPTSGSHGTRSQTLTTEAKKRSNPSLKTRFASKGVRRLFEDSSDSEFVPAKKSRRDTRSNTDSVEKEKENPFKKVYRDSTLNSSRRRSKVGAGDDMLDYKACIDMLVELMHHPSSWPFLIPVSKKDAPDYHLIIKRPMDFGTIRSKLNYMSYKNNEDFVRDIYLVLQNCEWFNPKSSLEFKAAQDLYKEVKRLLGEYQLCNPYATNDRPHNVNES